MSYTVEMAEEARPGEMLVEDKGARVLIEPKAVLFLIGAQMDYVVTKISATSCFRTPMKPHLAAAGNR